MDNQDVINSVSLIVRSRLEDEGSGHDWWHIFRVWKLSQNIGASEQVNMFVVELASLLHDIADWKFYNGDETVGPQVAREILESLHVEESVISRVCDIISTISFKGALVKDQVATIEGMVVQDADRLDAIGAIGIARTFAYGGHKNRVLHNPELQAVQHNSKEEYANTVGTTINHFSEKLLLLKDRMNTKTGKDIAEGRHSYMVDFLERFHEEWDGKR